MDPELEALRRKRLAELQGGQVRVSNEAYQNESAQINDESQRQK